MDKLLLNVDEAAYKLNLGRSKFLALVYSGQVKSVKVGRRVLIPAKDLEEYVEGLVERTHD